MARARALRLEIEQGLREHGRGRTDAGDVVYAYEVDGFGNAVLMDDANVPSLLSLPLLGWTPPDDPLYLATRRFVLSPENPTYFVGSAAAGIDSPHTPDGNVGPIGVAVQGLTTEDALGKRRLLDLLAATHAGTSVMHESFSADDPRDFTRPWFSWANAMFCELVLDVCGVRSYRRSPGS